jgi:hypothetical protein
MLLTLTFTCASADMDRNVYVIIYYFDDVGFSLKLELMSRLSSCVRDTMQMKGMRRDIKHTSFISMSYVYITLGEDVKARPCVLAFGHHFTYELN